MTLSFHCLYKYGEQCIATYQLFQKDIPVLAIHTVSLCPLSQLLGLQMLQFEFSIFARRLL